MNDKNIDSQSEFKAADERMLKTMSFADVDANVFIFSSFYNYHSWCDRDITLLCKSGKPFDSLDLKWRSKSLRPLV